MTRTRLASRNSISHLQSEERLAEIVDKYAKTANSRLRSMEKSQYSSTSKVSEISNAYRYVENQSHIGSEWLTTKNGKMIFKRGSKGRSIEELKKEALELDKFLFGVKTSTIKGAKQHYKNIRESIAKARDGKTDEVVDYFSKMSDKEFIDFWENKNMANVWKRFGSDIVIQILNITDNGKEIGYDRSSLIDRLEELANEKNLEDLTAETIVQKIVEDDIENFRYFYIGPDITEENTTEENTTKDTMIPGQRTIFDYI